MKKIKPIAIFLALLSLTACDDKLFEFEVKEINECSKNITPIFNQIVKNNLYDYKKLPDSSVEGIANKHYGSVVELYYSLEKFKSWNNLSASEKSSLKWHNSKCTQVPTDMKILQGLIKKEISEEEARLGHKLPLKAKVKEEHLKPSLAEELEAIEKANRQIDGYVDDIINDYRKRAIKIYRTNGPGGIMIESYKMKGGEITTCKITIGNGGKTVDCTDD